MRILEEKLDWRPYGGKHYESTYTRIFQSYILPVKFGYDKRRAHYSSLILSGQMTRIQALELLKEPPYNVEKIELDIEYLIKKFQITRYEFDNIMQDELKSYENFSPAFPKKVSKAENIFFSFLFSFPVIADSELKYFSAASSRRSRVISSTALR